MEPQETPVRVEPIRLDAFDAAERACRDYFGSHASHAAMRRLKNYYSEEAFDEMDIGHDWIAGDFANCDGIDVFVNGLVCFSNKFAPINREDYKRTMFNWFCYWLNVSSHGKPGGTMIRWDVMQIGDRFATLLCERLKIKRYRAEQIRDYFIESCLQNGFTEAEHIQDDLEEEDDSTIYHDLLAQLEANPLSHTQTHLLFQLLQSAALMTKPFALDTFQFSFDHNIFDETLKLCQEAKSLLPRKVSFRQQRNNEDSVDKCLIWTKCLDFINRYPLLSSYIDLYERIRASHNRQETVNKLVPRPSQDTLSSDQVGPPMSIKEWFEKRKLAAFEGTLSHDIHASHSQRLPNPSNFIPTALAAAVGRIIPRFEYSHAMSPIMYDRYNTFAKIACAMNKFLFVFTRGFEEHGAPLEDHLPLQIDLWIIPRLVKKGTLQNYELDDNELDRVRFDPRIEKDGGYYQDDEKDAVDEDDDEEDEGIQSLGKAFNGRDHFIWDIAKALEYNGYPERKEDDEATKKWKEGYIENKDYVKLVDEANFDEVPENTIRALIARLFREFVNQTDSSWAELRYSRFVLIVDRRNPLCIRQQDMTRDLDANGRQSAKTWSDRMYLFKVKKEGYDRISKHYAYALNESFLHNSRNYLFPMPMAHGDVCQDISTFDFANGYKFVISYHLYSAEKAKMYWYWNGFAMRFFSTDIRWLWPRYFEPKDAYNTPNSFQSLDDAQEADVTDAEKKFKLSDFDFQRFVATEKLTEQVYEMKNTTPFL
mmetsp:Transcript_55367/g.88298  ORF Transcript_55367/g.88298 Transcript_55367/m.88298 type:complete len:763 (+) Transcript_55367:26-2314(+)